MKILAVDYGDARTGLAICDKTELLASPIGTVAEKDTQLLIEKIALVVKEHDPELIVVGNPINMDGTSGFRSEKCVEFGNMLSEFLDLKVVMWDERGTTVSANNFLNMTDTRGKKRKKVIDTLAATIILENYLNFRKLS